ncbi:S1 RNA-binding domain-containing protein, partial [Nostoc sp. 'Peltigera malacea cyanobiont' DB3992]
IKEIRDLNVGMELEGIVTNVANFGAFVDIGVHQDGLVHISQLADRFVDDPNKVVKVGQVVKVQVLEINEKLKRISLSMKAVKQ